MDGRKHSCRSTKRVFLHFFLSFPDSAFFSKKEKKTGLTVLTLLGISQYQFFMARWMAGILAGFLWIFAAGVIGLIPAAIVGLLLQIPFRRLIKDPKKTAYDLRTFFRPFCFHLFIAGSAFWLFNNDVGFWIVLSFQNDPKLRVSPNTNDQ